MKRGGESRSEKRRREESGEVKRGGESRSEKRRREEK